ncbi:MAG: oligosaccharide flippase family protein [Myxococcales bacterium]|nr:oligosaccharide flippase family protein [Myxococcales bacterium]MDD9965516.1 oligosaccharide flippase family protein [Myxococcales bacterium]
MANTAGEARAATWTMASRVVAQGTQFAVFIVAARFLTPAQFGMYVLIQAINMLMAKVAEAGWREFTTTWQGESEADAQAFTLATLGGVGLALVGVVGAFVLSLMPDHAEYAGLQLLLALSIAGMGTTQVWSGQLIRTRRADALAKAVLLGQALGGSISIGGLVLDFGVTALGAGKLVAQVVTMIMIVAMAPWFPGIRLSSPGTPTIVKFTKSMLGSKCIAYLQGNAAVLLVSFFLGPTTVGLYRAGARVAGSVAEIVAEPTRIVCWMTLRRAAERPVDAGRAGQGEVGAGAPEQQAEDSPERAELAESAERFLGLSLSLATPVFLGVAVTAEPLVVALLGEQWRPSAPVVVVMALAHFIATQMVMTAPLLSLAGQVERIPMIDLFSGIATIAGLSMLAPFGLVPTALGQLSAQLATLWVIVRAHARYAAVSWARAVRQAMPSILAALAMVAVILLSRPWLHTAVEDARLQLAGEIVGGVLVFAVGLTALGGWRPLIAAYAKL